MGWSAGVGSFSQELSFIDATFGFSLAGAAVARPGCRGSPVGRVSPAHADPKNSAINAAAIRPQIGMAVFMVHPYLQIVN
jgi:hypothetical protein